MGYTISTRAQNKKLQEKMCSFMEKNYRLPSQIFGYPDNYSRFASNHYQKNSTLSYDSHKLALGFDFNACEPERDYIFAVTRWMALKVGQIRKFKGIGEAPCYVYDGGSVADDIWPVLVKSVWKGKKLFSYNWCLVPDTGFKPMADKYIGVPAYDEAKNKKAWIKERLGYLEKLVGGKVEKIDKKISDELDRLEKLWQTYTYKE